MTEPEASAPEPNIAEIQKKKRSDSRREKARNDRLKQERAWTITSTLKKMILERRAEQKERGKK